MALQVNRAELAQHMGASLPTVDRWVREGCPVAQRGARGVEWKFELPEVIRWWADRKVAAATGETTDLDEIEKRTALAKMQAAELDLAKRKGEVALVREFERAQTRMFALIRANIMNVPQRAVLQLLGETDEMIFKTKLTAELRLALETAAQAELTLDDENEEIEVDG